MKILLWILVGLVTFIAASIFYLSLFDEYVVIKKLVSPDRTRLGMIIGNHGGGGPGYCRDLIYNFPNSGNLPEIANESDNKKFLIKETGCDEITALSWNKNELILN